MICFESRRVGLVGDMIGLVTGTEDVELRRECGGERGVPTVAACVAAVIADEADVLIEVIMADERREEGGESARCGCELEGLVTVDRLALDEVVVENPVVITVGRLAVGTATPGEGGAGASVLAGASGMGSAILASTLLFTCEKSDLNDWIFFSEGFGL